MTDVKAVLFDLGDTLIYEKVDDLETIDAMKLQLRPNAVSTLRDLAKKYYLAVVSDTETSPESSVRRALRDLGVEHYFKAVVTSVDVGVRKPDSAIFREALRRLGVEPWQTVMVGNDPIRDIAGARRLGITTVLYRSSKYYRPDAADESDYAVDSLSEVREIIESLG